MTETNRPYLEVKDIVKKFPGVLALDHVSAKAYKGECLALLGINGAGKSTLMNVLAGEITHDDGVILIDGKDVDIQNQKDAEKNSIALIHQEAVVFDNLSIAENVFITVLSRYIKNGALDFKTMNEDASKYLQLVGCTLNPALKMETATVGNRQMVEIARALALGAEIILFDEPTSSLTIKEKEKLFEIINDLKKQGKTIIYITHFIDEALVISDKVCVMRDGRNVGDRLASEVTVEDIIVMMVGQHVKTIMNETGVDESQEIVLKAEHIVNRPRVNDVSLTVRKGEVLGIWGLLGSGRSETIRAMLGLDKLGGGTVSYLKDGKLEKIKPSALLREVGYVTENRHADGLFKTAPIWENITMPSLSRFVEKMAINNEKEHEFAQDLIKELTIKTPDENVRVDKLSGGNQQRVIMARWIGKNPDLFVLDEPTRGVDVSAKSAIHKVIVDLAAAGKSVILISSEIEEVMNLSDRIMVISDGYTVGEVNKADVTQQELMLMCVNERGKNNGENE